MSQRNLKELDDWRQSVVSQWTDHRVVDDLWVDLHIWFWEHLYADLAEYDLYLKGFTLREKADEWLLVLKLWTGETQRVAFCSGDTPTGCIRRLRKRLRGETFETFPDKFV